MENIALTTIGVKVSYAVEASAGVRPSTGYIHIPGIFSTPDLNPAPSVADTTSFDNLEYTSKTPLLKEMPDNIEFGARFGQGFADSWDALLVDYETGRGNGLQTWFCIDIPGYDKSIYVTGVPSALGMSAMEQNSGIDYTVYVTPTGEPVYASDPTYSNDTTYIAKFIVTGATDEDFVADALVTIFGKNYTATTDTNGEARFNLINGVYDYKVTKTGIDTVYGSLVINGANENIDVTGFNA